MKYLSLQVNINHTNNRGNHCLMIACQYHNDLNIVKLLIESSAFNINETNTNDDNCFSLALNNKTI